MNPFISTLFLGSVLFIAPAMAEDDIARFSIRDALSTPDAQQKLDPSVRLFFGRQAHPKIGKNFGEAKTNKKTNGFAKDDLAACQWAFLSAAIQLVKRAKEQGGDAVVNITSNFKDQPFSSETEYVCGSGLLMSGVAFKGDVVKLAR